MIAQGTDGVSRGSLNEGVAVNANMLAYIPIHLNAIGCSCTHYFCDMGIQPRETRGRRVPCQAPTGASPKTHSEGVISPASPLVQAIRSPDPPALNRRYFKSLLSCFNVSRSLSGFRPVAPYAVNPFLNPMEIMNLRKMTGFLPIWRITVGVTNTNKQPATRISTEDRETSATYGFPRKTHNSLLNNEFRKGLTA